jgi:hypothetical protein
MMKRKFILGIIISVLIAVSSIAIYFTHDPTVLWHEGDQRVESAIGVYGQLIEKASEPCFTDRIPMRTKWKYREQNKIKFATGFPNSSSSYLLKVEGGKIRCYSHYFQRRTSAFTLLHSSGCEEIATTIAGSLKKEFPGIPVLILKSDSPELRPNQKVEPTWTTPVD